MLEKPQNLPLQFQYLKKFIGYKDSNTTDLIEFIKDYKNIFLKLDIEGGELNLFTSLFQDSLNNIKQLAFEIHDIFSLNQDKVLQSLINLNKTHHLVHIHENNHWEIPTKIEENLYCQLLELTYIRKDCEIEGLNKTDFPLSGIDFPNAPHLKSYNLNIWPFKI
jgi:hypothetical protein